MIEQLICAQATEALLALYGATDFTPVSVQKTRKEFEGDFTIVVFPYVKLARKSPEATAEELGTFLCKHVPEIASFNIVKGFLNLTVQDGYWLTFMNTHFSDTKFGSGTASQPQSCVVEYSSPNTNKPLHLGHIRNNLLGYAVSEVLRFAGHHVHTVNLVNDRGIHICKSMLAWQKWGNGETPESSGIKGDFLAGKYYVLFETNYREQVAQLTATGISPEEAAQKAPLMQEARELLIKWENKDADTILLWKTMNGWVLNGFDVTYKKLGISFDKTYFESDTYLTGKDIIEEGLRKQVFYRKADNSVWIDLSGDGLDEKLLLRSDGTSVYMTQDLGTALMRRTDFDANRFVYVVGNEQNYHFDVLKLILKKLGMAWSEGLYHLSYGMVELPEGKMKSREGKVVDADELIAEMYETARSQTETLGKTDGFSPEEAASLYHKLAMGALKYFILKVDPKKNMIFNPAESIDFNGNTGPFIQYSCVRITSLLKKAADEGLLQQELSLSEVALNEKEKALLRLAHEYPTVAAEASENMSPALIANYIYELAKEFNQFYHDFPVLKEPDTAKVQLRLRISAFTGNILRSGLALLGIEAPERM